MGVLSQSRKDSGAAFLRSMYTRTRARLTVRGELAADHVVWLVVENSTRFGLSFLMSGPRTPMPGVHDLWLFILTGLLLNATPGPDIAYIVGRSAQWE